MVLFPLGAAAGVDSLEMTGDEYSQGAGDVRSAPESCRPAHPRLSLLGLPAAHSRSCQHCSAREEAVTE